MVVKTFRPTQPKRLREGEMVILVMLGLMVLFYGIDVLLAHMNIN